MLKRKYLLLFAALSLTPRFLCAKTILLSIVQNEDAPQQALEISRELENTILENLFAQGQIACNDKIRLDGANFSGADFGIKEAREGSADYLLAVYADYGAKTGNSKTEKNVALIQNLSYKIVDITTGGVVGEKSIKASAYLKKSKTTIEAAKLMADEICGETYAALNL